jgi:hypothetical protein
MADAALQHRGRAIGVRASRTCRTCPCADGNFKPDRGVVREQSAHRNRAITASGARGRAPVAGAGH